MTSGPIIIVEDDLDDQELYREAMNKLGVTNELQFFETAKPTIEYLLTTKDQPFIILSDVNMPGMNGIEFKAVIQQDSYLREKGIPFVFISTNASASVVRKAHQLSVQGYFEKPSSMAGLIKMLEILFEYWELSKHINNT